MNTAQEITEVLVRKEPAIHIIGCLVRQHGARRVLDCLTTALAIMEVEHDEGTPTRNEMQAVLKSLNNLESAA